MRKQIWISERDLNQIDWIIACNAACNKWMNKNMDEISLFYSYFTIKQHKMFVEEIIHKIGVNLHGTGLEIGAGPGIFSNSILKIFTNVKKIYLLDKAPNTFNLMKQVAKQNSTLNKLDCIIGSFNDLKFPDNSLDFILDFDSIHHSEDFDLTFKEISRVLKPGGVLLCFDRAQPNYISKQQIKDMLDIEYSDEYKKENNINLNEKMNRKMQGETEPLLKDWINTAKKNHLISEVYIFHKKSFKDFIKAMYGLFIPYFLKAIIKKGINISTHYQVLLSYFGIKNIFINGVKVFNLDYKPKSKRSPRAKMVFYFKKI
jgi:ubiquinone/menaquinone biosynthesis C-methylase UbiE